MIVLVLFFLISALSSSAQTIPYAGAIAGVATISADGASKLTTQGLSLSSYAPANGGALNLFAGAQLDDYFSVQANLIWNRNSLRFNSSSSGGSFYQEDRSSSQEAAVFDFLIYFRRRSSRIRPYLGTGGGVVHLSSAQDRIVVAGGTPSIPPAKFASAGPVLRSHVGIDFRLTRKLDFRYSFSDLIGRNEISKHLSPPGSRVLENFHNLFGFVWRF